jgi:hypothetical protein
MQLRGNENSELFSGFSKEEKEEMREKPGKFSNKIAQFSTLLHNNSSITKFGQK